MGTAKGHIPGLLGRNEDSETSRMQGDLHDPGGRFALLLRRNGARSQRQSLYQVRRCRGVPLGWSEKRVLDNLDRLICAGDANAISFSLGWTRTGGASDDRVYLEEHNVLGPRTIVVWTSLKELPEELAEDLRAGNPPWTNWQSHVEERTDH